MRVPSPKRPLLLALAFVSLACADDSEAGDDGTTGDATSATGTSSGGAGGPDESSSDGSSQADIAELAQCEETDIQVLPFSGAAFDPATGALLEPLPVPHVVATTVGWTEGATPEVLSMHTGIVINDVFTHPGLLGASFALSDACHSARTITLWADEAAMMQFVMGDAHMTAIQTALSSTIGWETTHWSEGSDDQPPTWERARQQLDDVRDQ
jgi:hypothetical protein